jgi:trimethylamine--corrinoid protein Co-methyltransferase
MVEANYSALLAPQFRKLSDDQLAHIHAASLEILERTGVYLHLPAAVELLRKAGAHVTDDGWVHIPSHLVEWALSIAPRRIVWANRHGKRVMALEGRNVYYGPGSDCPNVIDVRTGERRPGTLADIVEAIRVMDALPNIDFLMSFCMASDKPQAIADRCQMQAMLSNSVKPILFVAIDFAGCVDAVEMAEIVAGGAEALRRNPLCACYINVAGPLQHNAESLQKLLFMADKGLPCTYNPVVLRGTNGPVTLAGAVALANAGELAGLVIAQLRREGASVILSGGTQDMFDMRTTQDVYAAPENRVLCVEMAHYYGLPIFGLGGCSDSQLPDEQAAAEIALSLLTETLAGSHLIHDVGYLASGMCNSLESVVMADELIAWVKRFMQGIEVGPETLALDVIHQAGPKSDFVKSPHTRAHFREDWYPRLIERQRWENWTAGGGQTFRERARARALQLLDTHQPEPLPENVAKAIQGVVDRAAEKPGGQPPG